MFKQPDQQMLSDVYQAQLQWRRVAVYRPMRVDVEVVKRTAACRPAELSGACDGGMRVLLRREPTSHDQSAIALCARSGRRIGALPAEIAEWVAPLLDSGKAAFDGELWSLEGSAPRCGQLACCWLLVLTHHELLPKIRSSWDGWWLRAVAATVACRELMFLTLFYAHALRSGKRSRRPGTLVPQTISERS